MENQALNCSEMEQDHARLIPPDEIFENKRRTHTDGTRSQKYGPDAMKPFLFNFPCPACGGMLQVEFNQQGLSLPCPMCNQEITVPAAPPRTVGGWLFLPAIGYTFQLGLFFLLVLLGALQLAEKPEMMLGALFFSPVALVAGIGAWAMWKKKRWFRWYYVANCWGSTLLYAGAAIYGRDSEIGAKSVSFAIWSSIWTLYFLKSQRVKETFIL